MSSGILHTGALTRDAESKWTAQTFRCDSGVNVGMARFRPTDMVYDGTDEELVWSLTAMPTGARVERWRSNSGVITHLVHSDRRVDTRAMLASVGLNVPNTNPTAHHPFQSFITHGTTVATTPTHRDENNALLVQRKGSKEILIHPPALALPGCPASVFGDAAATNNPRWLAFGPFQLASRVWHDTRRGRKTSHLAGCRPARHVGRRAQVGRRVLRDHGRRVRRLALRALRRRRRRRHHRRRRRHIAARRRKQ